MQEFSDVPSLPEVELNKFPKPFYFHGRNDVYQDRGLEPFIKQSCRQIFYNDIIKSQINFV